MTDLDSIISWLPTENVVVRANFSNVQILCELTLVACYRYVPKNPFGSKLAVSTFHKFSFLEISFRQQWNKHQLFTNKSIIVQVILIQKMRISFYMQTNKNIKMLD